MARLLARLLLAGAIFLAGIAFYAGFVEPYNVVLEEREVRVESLPDGLDGLRILQISDLESHGRGVRESQVERIARQADADLVVVTGDLVAKTLRGDERLRAAAEIADLLGGIPSRYGTWFVEGHGERLSEKVRRKIFGLFAEAGMQHLDDEAVTLSINGERLALVGLSVHSQPRDPVFQVREGGDLLQIGNSSPGSFLNAEPVRLPPDYYQLTGELRFSREDAGIGVTFANLMPEGKDRFYRLRRTESGNYFRLSPHGTYFERGRTSSMFSPSPGPWYGFRVEVAREPRGNRVRARTWPASIQEPEEWLIDALDTSHDRPAGGTMGVWTTGSGRKEFRNLRLTGREGETLLEEGRMAGGEELRWSLAGMPTYLLSVNEQISEGEFVLAISHSPDIFPSIARLGWPLLLAGHTQGGQVRLPWYGALSTDSALGREFAAGLFRSGSTQLYISRGVGTSRIPVRFLAPPEVTVITLRRAPNSRAAA